MTQQLHSTDEESRNIGEREKKAAPQVQPLASLNMLSSRLSVLLPDHADIELKIQASQGKVAQIKDELGVLKQTEENLNEVFDHAYPAATSKMPGVHRALQKINRTFNIANTQTGLIGRQGSAFGIGFRSILLSASSGALAGQIALLLPSLQSVPQGFFIAIPAVAQLMAICVSSLAKSPGGGEEPFIEPHFHRRDIANESVMRSGMFLELWGLLPAIIAGVPLQFLKTVTVDGFRAIKRRKHETAEMGILKKYLAQHPKDASLPAQAVINNTVTQYSQLERQRRQFRGTLEKEYEDIALLKEMKKTVKSFPDYLAEQLKRTSDKVSDRLVNDLYGEQYKRMRGASDKAFSEGEELERLGKEASPLEAVAQLPKEVAESRELLRQLLILAAHPEIFEQFKNEQLTNFPYGLTRKLSEKSQKNADIKTDITNRYKQYCENIFAVIDDVIETSTEEN